MHYGSNLITRFNCLFYEIGILKIVGSTKIRAQVTTLEEWQDNDSMLKMLQSHIHLTFSVALSDIMADLAFYGDMEVQ